MTYLKRINNNKAVALMSVLLIFMVLIIMLGSIMIISINNQHNTQASNNNTRSYYAAESALNLQKSKLDEFFASTVTANSSWNQMVTNLTTFVATLNETIQTDTTNIPASSAVVSVLSVYTDPSVANTIYIQLQSVGSVGSTQRTLQLDTGYLYKQGTSNGSISKAIMTSGTVDLGTAGGIVEGPIGSNLTVSGSSIKINKYLPKIDVLVPRTGAINNPSNVGGKIVTNAPIVTFPNITYPYYPKQTELTTVNYTYNSSKQATLNLTNHSYLNSLTVADGYSLTINLGTWTTTLASMQNWNGGNVSGMSEWFNYAVANNVKILRVKSIDCNGKIRVTGKGRLMILFDYKDQTGMTLGDKTNIRAMVDDTATYPSDFDKISLVLRTTHLTQSSSSYNLFQVKSSGCYVWASVLAEYVNIAIESNASAIGHYVTKGRTVSFFSNASVDTVLFYAPFADVNISSGAHMTGSVVSKTFTLGSSNSSLIYKEIDPNAFPFDIILPFTEYTAQPAQFSHTGSAIVEK